MGKQLVGRILTTVKDIKWPETAVATARGKRAYDVALEKVDSYKGDPKDLASALRTAMSGQSRPYACATLAYVIIVASKETDGTYVASGLKAAMHWLEQAQANEPDEVDINFLEALIYVHQGLLDEARLVLNYLQGQDPSSYHLRLAEIAYWQAREDEEKIAYWFDRALESSVSVPQKLRLQTRRADHYLRQNMLDEALKMYQKAVHFDKGNPMLWHNMSLIYYEQGQLEEAARCNQRALKLKDFPAARRMSEAIKKKTSTTGVLGRLFGGS